MARARGIFISELLVADPDEGAQVLAHELAAHFHIRHDHAVLGPTRSGTSLYASVLGERALGYAAIHAIRRERPSGLVYMPQSGLTRSAVARVALLRAACPRASIEVVVVQLHNSGIAPVVSRLLSWIASEVIVANESQSEQLMARGLNASVLAPRVPLAKVSRLSKADARVALGWKSDERVFLHVGHARSGRGIDKLGALAEFGRVVLVLSDAFEADESLIPEGLSIEVHRGHVSNLCDMYRAADVYVFPTVSQDSVIGMPMSILEAQANGTQVVAMRSSATSRFDGEQGVRLYDSLDELLAGAQRVPARLESATSADAEGVEQCRGDFSICVNPRRAFP